MIENKVHDTTIAIMRSLGIMPDPWQMDVIAGNYQRLLLNSEILRLDDAARRSALRTLNSAFTVIQDRMKFSSTARVRLIEACEQAYHFGKGKLTVSELHPPSSILHPRRFSNRLHCAKCDLEYRDPSTA